MKILGLDIETGGRFEDPIEKNFITEIGVVLWDTELQQPVKMYGAIIKDGPASSEEAIEYTGITNEMRQLYGVGLNQAMFAVLSLINEADYVMAHNGEDFDKPIVMSAIANILDGGETSCSYPDKVWIDSLIDREYPKKYINHNLTYLKGAKEITAPGHRAIFDVLAMLKMNLTISEPSDIFNEGFRLDYELLIKTCIASNLERMISSANTPMVTVRAHVTFQDLAGRTAAKKEKFIFNGDTKLWTKRMRRKKLETVNWPFAWSTLS